MSIYTKTIGGLGYTVYKRDRRPCKTADVPGNIMTLLETQDEVDDTELKLEKPLNKCVFCGMFTRLSRQANGQSIDICEEHYHNSTLGQLVQQVRLNEEAKYAKANQD